MLSACTVDHTPSKEVIIIENSCPKVELCTIQNNELSDNQSLLDEISILKKAWFFCADQVDMIIQCQEQQYEKARTDP
ncbi:hypothetical protein GCM10023211_21410 [Orbus sasakiae]|uniref:Uncharacterized protein n=1 Tax=Orbus sasakiae TaxID=1078475 RepID=A0ABP9NCY2_9GAMM